MSPQRQAVTVSNHAERGTPEPNGDPRWWFACDHPERPHAEWTIYVFECDRCTLALVAAVAADPDAASDEYDHTHRRDKRTTLADTLANVRAWRAEQGYRPL